MNAELPLDKQLLDELSPWIAKAKIIVQSDNEECWRRLRSKYPAGIGAIDWTRVPNARSSYAAVPRIPPAGILSSVPVSKHAAEIRACLCEFGDEAGIGLDDRVMVLCDGITDDSFEMAFATLLEVFQVIFSYPQHLYVVSSDACWCFMFSEFEMHYGSASGAR